MSRLSRRTLLSALTAVPAAALQTEFRVYTEHPRLLLPPSRLRLLRRERERQSPRWSQLELLVKGGAALPETAFAAALCHQVSGDAGAGQRAVEHALKSGTGQREAALVFDWCQAVLTPKQAAVLAARLREPPRSTGLRAASERCLAAVALAGHEDHPEEPILQQTLRWWRTELVPALNSGSGDTRGGALYPLLELLHLFRDNLQVDLRDDARRWFTTLPHERALSYYPAPYPAPENEYRIPAPAKEPDLQYAALARAAELALVSFDPNPRNVQFLQGMLHNDRFTMRGAFGSAYEFLWANPYTPGLGHHHLPLRLYDPVAGRLLVRSSWDDDALWLSASSAGLEIFENGSPRRVTSDEKTLDVGEVTVVRARQPRLVIQRPQGSPPLLYVTGLPPSRSFAVETDGEELAEATSDRAGILEITSARTDARIVRIAPFGYVLTRGAGDTPAESSPPPTGKPNRSNSGPRTRPAG